MIGNITAGLYGVGVAPSTNSYESIATVTVGSGGSSSISFSSIPSTYKHLQIRGISRNTAGFGDIGMQVNGSTNISRRHLLYGTGSSATATSDTVNSFYIQPESSGLASSFGVFITDILDYGSTSKNKTIKTLNGYDFNGSGLVLLISTLLETTSAIGSITITPSGGSFAQHSHFALYGIKD
jgi:hypothetical protein